MQGKENVNNVIFFFIAPSICLWNFELKLIYLTPVVMLAYLWAGQTRDGIKFDFKKASFILGYIFILILGYFINVFKIIQFTFIRDAVIVSSCIILHSFPIRITLKGYVVLLLSVMISYHINSSFDLDIGVQQSLFETDSNDGTEYHNGISFGLFLITFLIQGKFILAFISLIYAIISQKRIIYLGLLFLIFLYPLIRKNNKWYPYITFGTFVVLVIVGFYINDIARWTLSVFDYKNIGISKFLMGRDVLNNIMIKFIKEGNFFQYLFGHGAGQSDVMMQRITLIWYDMFSSHKPMNPHNDYLKIFYDYGIFGIVFFASLYSFLYQNKRSYFLTIYTLPLLLLDNSFLFITYQYVWFFSNLVLENDLEPV